MHRSLLLSCIFTLGVLFAGAQAARAQDDDSRWEVGGHLSAFDVTNGSASVSRVVPCLVPPCPVVTIEANQRRTEPGFGARVGYSFNRYLTAEAEVSYFPSDPGLDEEEFTGGRKLQGLFGVKAGRRYEHFGLFAKARPGFVRFGKGDLYQPPGTGCIAVFPPPLPCFDSRGRTDFALDVGGVLELYPSPRTVIRFDAGDTILRSGAHGIPVPNASAFGAAAVPIPGETTHNFQGGVGFGLRF